MSTMIIIIMDLELLKVDQLSYTCFIEIEEFIFIFNALFYYNHNKHIKLSQILSPP